MLMWFSSPEAVCFKWLAWTLFCTAQTCWCQSSDFRFCCLKKQVLIFKTDFSCSITDAFHHLPLRDPLEGQKRGSSVQSILPNKIQGNFWQKVLEEKSWKSVSYQDWVSVYTTDRYLLQNLYYSGKVGISCLKKIVASTVPEEPDSYSRNFSRAQFFICALSSSAASPAFMWVLCGSMFRQEEAKWPLWFQRTSWHCFSKNCIYFWWPPA